MTFWNVVSYMPEADSGSTHDRVAGRAEKSCLKIVDLSKVQGSYKTSNQTSCLARILAAVCLFVPL